MPADMIRKWRPRLWTVVLLVLAIVLCLPIAGLILFRFYDNQLVQQTEESVLAQAAVMVATYADLYSEAAGLAPPKPKPVSAQDAIFPSLSINSATVLPPRPDAANPSTSVTATYQRLAPQLSRIASSAQAQTLAGYRFLDTQGNVIAGTAEIGRDLGHVSEVRAALDGHVVSVARTRVRDSSPPALYTLSRGARVRVFVAMPVHVNEALIGAVYVSRTPSHIFRFLYGERFNLLKAAAFVALSTTLIGYVFWRFITRPIRLLKERSQLATQGNHAFEAPDHLGTREIEDLSLSFKSLTERLQNNRDALKTYTAHVTHELKSPLTALKGAAELLRDDDLSQSQRHRLLDTIEKGGTRIEDLLAHMRAFSLADQQAMSGRCSLEQIQDQITRAFPALSIMIENGSLGLPSEATTLSILLTHLLQNAQQHGAKTVKLCTEHTNGSITLRISDDGEGISAGNADKILQPFFTTRRDSGGTGMGLNIVKSTVEALGGHLYILPQDTGAGFELEWPNATASLDRTQAPGA
ncbi:sensor histidine kinase [Tritonibacter mobilis]|uniref:sensor histidine kinase n=1 Tax=Tritonibacter mobilis TaxID=379347 RepID=UPI003A5C50BA